MSSIQRTRRLTAGLAGLALAAIAGAQSISSPQAIEIPQAVEQTARRHITAAALRGPIRFLAHDLLEGRAPASRGEAIARAYLAAELESLGYEPGGPNGQWEQVFDVVGVTAQAPQTWSFRGNGKSVDLKWSQDFIAASGVQDERAVIENAELVFVGYGIQAPEYQWDDFKGMDLRGKVLLMLNNDPDWDPKLFEGNRRLYYGRWTYKYESAARQGAAGAIIIHTTPSAGYPWQVVQSSWTGEQFELPAAGEPRIQVKGWATEEATRRLVQAAGRSLDELVQAARSRDFKPVPLGLRTSITLTNRISRVQTANVAGLLRGSDPELSKEVVVYSAHYDHLGVGEPDAEGDRIYNGARDNAAGSAQLLAIARAFAALPERPRRSILILFVAAEEQGLLGSSYYAQNPTFPPGRIAANINYDGGNIWGATRDVTFIGMGKSSLDAIVQALAQRQGRTVKPDQFPDRGFYYRSDQFAFAKIGVPAVYLDDGTEYVGRPEGWGKQQMEAWEAKHYHQPSDELDDSWNFDGMIQDTELGFLTGWVVAQSDTLPQWNPGDEFEAARKRALAEVAQRP
ncbi:MAG: M28 family metallopeptidase [Pseudomonadota bacterium]|jgi:Predicted aminopeptidases|nr:MAG: peptidase M28 [Pseudomonadota bacterium]